MKTTLDLLDILYDKLSGSSLKTDISGGIYRKRPLNSTQEDIVINCLPINNDELQLAILNVNLHVPNITINTPAGQDTTQPNIPRLKVLARTATDLLSEVWFGDYHFHIQQQNMLSDDDANDHYINIRLEFYSVNLN